MAYSENWAIIVALLSVKIHTPRRFEYVCEFYSFGLTID